MIGLKLISFCNKIKLLLLFFDFLFEENIFLLFVFLFVLFNVFSVLKFFFVNDFLMLLLLLIFNFNECLRDLLLNVSVSVFSNKMRESSSLSSENFGGKFVFIFEKFKVYSQNQ